MDNKTLTSKRRLLAATLGLAALGKAAATEALLRSVYTDVGPFYPVKKPADTDADLTRIAGRPGRAQGEVIEIRGRLLDLRGRALAGAQLEVWQANAAGRYNHPGDSSDLPLDENFQGYSRIQTGADGTYRLLTIKPGNYPAGNYLRAAHLHFDVTGATDRLITQLYFPNTEAVLAADKVFNKDLSLYPKAFRSRLFPRLEAGAAELERGADLYHFDIVLENG
jgi:protocatechuate 3,4-dioxygenase beta subunit